MIRLGAFLNHEGGWTQHARSFAHALNRYERTELVDWDRWKPKRSRSLYRAWRRRLSASVGISLGAIERTCTLDARYRVAFCVWETTRIPGPILFHLLRADMVWTMSNWGREILLAHGVAADKIAIVPAGVDTTRFAPPPGGRSADPPFRFLSVGKWEERKGNALLVRAFAEEFDPVEPVELVLHCGTSWPRERNVRQEIAEELAAAGRGHARITFSEPLEPGRFADLLQSCHAFVLPTRAEAWGLPILEAMACELPCIVTGYSELTEYANENNCYLVRVQAMIPVADPEFFLRQYDYGLWAQPDAAHLRSLMRFVYRHPERAMEKARQARQDAERCWTWDLAARKAMAHIGLLRTRGGG